MSRNYLRKKSTDVYLYCSSAYTLRERFQFTGYSSTISRSGCVVSESFENGVGCLEAIIFTPCVCDTDRIK